MKIKTVLIVVIAAAGVVGGVLILAGRSRPDGVIVSKSEPVAQPAPVAAAEPGAPPETADSNPPPAPPAQPAHPATSTAAKAPAQPDNTPAGQSLAINGYTVQDPFARIALSSVGADPDAEAYWAQAINDPNLPAEERKDLIEDLNEDGLSDPHHPGPQDMQLIARRIRLIEELAPLAADKVNADAFNEAYKDLVNLYNGLPVD